MKNGTIFDKYVHTWNYINWTKITNLTEREITQRNDKLVFKSKLFVVAWTGWRTIVSSFVFEDEFVYLLTNDAKNFGWTDALLRQINLLFINLRIVTIISYVIYKYLL